MRIAVDLSFFIADQRGMGRVVRNILKELLIASEDDWIFFVRKVKDVAPVNAWLQAVNPSVRMKTILDRELKNLSVDVCWYPWNRVDVRPLSGRRIVTIHDVNPFVFPYKSIWRRWDQRKDETQFHQAAKDADLIVTISDFSRREIMRYLGVDEKKITVIPNGLESRWLESDTSAAPAKTAAASAGKSGGPHLLYVGSDDERKNLRSLLETLGILHRISDFRVTLTCCGVGNEAAQKYSPLLQANNVEDWVTFAGFVPDEQLRIIYRQADLFVFPSLYEGFGLPILEAMGAGLPVVTSLSASLPEVGGDAVVYCDAGDPMALAQAICDIWNNPGLQRQLKERGLQRAAQFTWSGAAQKLRNVFIGEVS